MYLDSTCVCIGPLLEPTACFITRYWPDQDLGLQEGLYHSTPGLILYMPRWIWPGEISSVVVRDTDNDTGFGW